MSSFTMVSSSFSPFHHMSPATVESRANNVIEFTDARQAKNIYYERIAAAHAEAEDHVGIILREFLLLKVMRIFIENLVKRSQSKIATHIFFDRTQVVDWLKACIKN